MDVNHVTKEIEASLQRSALILNADKNPKMQRQNLLYGGDLPRQQPPKPKESTKTSGTFNTVRLKKYLGLGTKKKTNPPSQNSYYPQLPVKQIYPDVIQQPVYPTRYPEGWMYTTVTSKTVHTVYTAMRMRGGGYRQRPAMYAWDPYSANIADLESDPRYGGMCICGIPPSSSSTWSRGQGRGQCTCNSDECSPLSKEQKGSNKKLSGTKGKFSTVSSASSGSKRKSILECEVSAYDLISKGGKEKDNSLELDDGLNENFLEQSNKERNKNLVSPSTEKSVSGNPKVVNLNLKGKEVSSVGKKVSPATSGKTLASTKSNQKMVDEWDNYYGDTKEMRIGGQRMLITDPNQSKPITTAKNTRELPSRQRPTTSPASTLTKPTNQATNQPTNQVTNQPTNQPTTLPRSTSPPPNLSRPTNLLSCGTSQVKNPIKWQLPKPRVDNKLKCAECPRIPRLQTERHGVKLEDKSSTLILQVPSQEKRETKKETKKETTHLSREVLFEEDEADDEQSPIATRSRSTPNLAIAIRNSNSVVVKPILKKGSCADTSSETDSDLYGSDAASLAERRRKKHVHFKSRGPMFTNEPVVEEIPPLEMSDCSESEEEDVQVEIRPPTPPIRISEDADYLEPKRKSESSQPFYANQPQTQESDFYDDCNQTRTNDTSKTSKLTSISKTETNQSRQSSLRRTQSERPRQRSPPNQEDNPRSPPPRTTSLQKTMKNEQQEQQLEHNQASKQLDKLIREKGSNNILPKSIKDSLRPEENLYDDTAMSEDFGLPETGKEPFGEEVKKLDGEDFQVFGENRQWKGTSGRRLTWENGSSSVEFITNLRNRTFQIPRPPLVKSRSVPVRANSLRVVGVSNRGFGSNPVEEVAIYEQIGEPIYEELPDYPQCENATTLALLSPPTESNPSPVGDGPRRSIFEGASRNEILSILQDAKERGVEDMEVEQSNTNVDQTNELENQVLPSINRIRISNISNLSDSSHSSEDSTTTDDNKTVKERRCSVEVERNDSGVGPETSKPTRLRRQSSIGPSGEELTQCEDCDQNVETKSNAGNLFEPLICKKCAKKRAERRGIIAEIVETEIKYGRDLRIIRDEFSRPMAVAGLLTPDQLVNIFLNIDELIDINTKFTEKLRDAIDIAVEQGDDDYTTVNIGKIFQDATPMLRAFESYCIGQGSACLLLNSLEKEKELLRIFLRVSQMENTLLRRMNLNSFLMIPVQRVTKYPLLLNRLYKVTSYQHKDRDAIKSAQQKIELHLEHINQQAKDISGTKIWRRISHISTTKRLPINEQELGGNIKLRKMALEVLEWNAELVRFVWEGKLLFTHITDHLWNRRSRTLKMTPVYALLLTLGKPNDNYRPDEADGDELLFPQNTGIREATIVLSKEKNNRQSLVREPIFLQNCVICSDCESEEMFEIQDFVNKEAYLFKAEDLRGSQEWLRQLRYHAKDLGSWRRRRNALANIMINGMVR